MGSGGMIRAVAFDLDGTLIDTAPDLGAAANAMLRQIGRAEVSAEAVMTFIGGGLTEFVERALAASGPSDSSPAFRAGAEVAFRTLYRKRLFERSRIYAGVGETLDWLQSNSIAAACVTNKESHFALPLLDAAGLRQRFAQCFCADLASDRKPMPNLLLAACAYLDVSPRELLYVGDSRTDIIAARSAGCPSAAVGYGYQDAASLRELQPDFIVANLLDLVEKLPRKDTTADAALDVPSSV